MCATAQFNDRLAFRRVRPTCARARRYVCFGVRVIVMVEYEVFPMYAMFVILPDAFLRSSYRNEYLRRVSYLQDVEIDI